MNKNKYTVAIVGCGSIGALKDDTYDSPSTDAVLTHAHAFYRHPKTNLTLLIDTDQKKALEAGTKWHTGAASYEIWRDRKIYSDIVVIATPTETHYEVLMEALDHQPKLVVAEKPFCSNIKEARDVAAAYNSANIPILVDYIRRFDDMHSDVLAKLKAGEFGEIYHARCLYGRGLRHDGCHALDIFCGVLGKPTGLVFNHGGIIDRAADDPSYTIRLEFDRCREVYMVGTDSRAWGCFEMEFVTEKGILRFSDWGKTIKHYAPEQEQTFGQYQSLSSHAVTRRTGLDMALLHLADNAVRFLDGTQELRCTAQDAIHVHEILEHIGGSK